MTYEEQIYIIQSAKDGKAILGRKKGSEDWDYYDPRCSYKNLAKFPRDFQFDFQNFEYKVME